jgi:hypothetical protein
MDRLLALGHKYTQLVRSTPAPAQWKSLKAHWLRAIVDDKTTAAEMLDAIKDEDLGAFISAYRGFDEQSAIKLDRRFDAAGVTDCVDHRRS